MGISIGIISARNAGYHPNMRLSAAARERGHGAILINPYTAWSGLIKGDHTLFGDLEKGRPDIIVPRQGAQVRDSCLALLRHLILMGIPSANDFEAVLVSRNQYLTLQSLAGAGIPVPDTMLANSEDVLMKAADHIGGYPFVAKQVSGRQGQGIMLVRSRKDCRDIATNHLDINKGILLQKFIPPQGRKDIRVFVLGDKAVASMELKPKQGDFRANYHLSGMSKGIEIGPQLSRIAVKAASVIGLDIAGIDMIVDGNGKSRVVEVNYSPGFKGLEAATGMDIAGMIIDHVHLCYLNKRGTAKTA